MTTHDLIEQDKPSPDFSAEPRTQVVRFGERELTLELSDWNESFGTYDDAGKPLPEWEYERENLHLSVHRSTDGLGAWSAYVESLSRDGDSEVNELCVRPTLEEAVAACYDAFCKYAREREQELRRVVREAEIEFQLREDNLENARAAYRAARRSLNCAVGDLVEFAMALAGSTADPDDLGLVRRSALRSVLGVDHLPGGVVGLDELDECVDKGA